MPCKSERSSPFRLRGLARLIGVSTSIFSYADSLESGLEAEVENGRVARMLIKLGFINERPE